MPKEPLALSTIPTPPPAASDYDAICATVMESARGRWFLQEYARRNRNADTRLLLAAIERIETVIRGERDQQVYQSFRTDLLEMATAIAQTRAEVAEIRPEAQPGGKATPGSVTEPEAAVAPDGPDVFATAERIQDVVWTMRERGLDPATCEQIEALATSILSVSSLRDPNDYRTRMLSEVLRYLERRIGTMLDACAEATQAAAADNSASDAVSESYPLHGNRGHDADMSRTVTDETANAAQWLDPASDAIENSALAPDATLTTEEAPVASVSGPQNLPELNEHPSGSAPAIETEARSETSAAMAQELGPEPVLAASAPVPSETVELEIEPLVVASIGQHEAIADTPAELELDPIMVEPLFPPPGIDATLPSGAPATEPATTSEPVAGEPASLEPEHPSEVLVAELVVAGPGVPAGEMTLFFEEPESEPSPADSIPMVAAAAELEVPAAAAAPTKAQGEVAESTRLAEPPATMPEAEPADFLLEPVPLTATSSTPLQSDPAAAAPPPTEPSVDAIIEIEEELFVLAPENGAHAAPVEQPPLQLEAPAEPIPQPAARAVAMAVATPEQTPAPTAMVTASTIAIAPSVTPSRPIAKPMPRPAPSDPLAALKAMSDEERIAFFS